MSLVTTANSYRSRRARQSDSVKAVFPEPTAPPIPTRNGDVCLVMLVSCPINNSLAAPRLLAPGGVAPPRPCPVIISASSARLARHENPRADRASYLWDRTLGPEQT